MPIPLIIAGGAAVISLGTTVHSSLKQRKWKKIHDERLAEVQAVQKKAENVYSVLKISGESLGRVRVQATDTLKEAAVYLSGVTKQYRTESIPEIPSDILKEWITLQSEIAQSVGIGVAGATLSGVTAAAGPALYTAAGLFGVASTGTRIAGLSGAAANSARLAWIGGGAVAAGGGGVALGSTILNVINGANVVTTPISVAVGIWNEKKAHDLEKKVTAQIKEFAAEEAKLRRKMTAMHMSTKRAGEIEGSVRATDDALKEQLRTAKAFSWGKLKVVKALKLYGNLIWYWTKALIGRKPKVRPQPDLREAYRIYHTATALRKLIEEPAISEANRRIIEE